MALGPAPDAWQVKQRVRWLLAMVPYGRILTYSDALTMVGAPAGFARALPSYLKAWANEAAPAAEVSEMAAADEAAVEAVPTGELVEAVGAAAAPLPLHRMTATSGALVTRYVPAQRAALEAEGVRVLSRRGEECVELSECRWQPTHAELYLRAVERSRSRP